ncbi:LIM domain only protein 7b isoform X3 [Pangasianodon hypophthalmus]|uniref:LIM domain only protein 7b isoform X3 n=1 Tax=Pangasianodon hypophthalmus TaxID=310915 RepID=UPI002307A4C9|nr:LIM domain only protein 7b isoform X3 [Pangasianodon hypophthalmus]
MEWREQTAVGCEVAFREAQRWIEEVTKKRFGSSNFRSALENGVLLCDLINKLKPGIIKRVNRLSTPIAGLDNVNVFLKACGKLGLNDAQLFHPGDLQDVSTRVTVRRQETSRRLKNVLITIYWLGRKAQADPSYSGPQLNFKAFEGLLGVALSKALEEASCSKSSVRDSGFAETWYPDREVPSYRREDSVESLDSVESHTLSVASDCTLIAGSEGFGSDAEAEHCFRMTEPLSASGTERRNLPAALRKKRFVQHEEGGRGRVSPLHRAPTGHSARVGSKSMSDITPEPVAQEAESSTSFHPLKSQRGKAATVSLRQERIRQYQARLRESEAKWQEDLTRWKTRRRSVNSDLHRKKDEQEQLGFMSSGTVPVGGEQEQSFCRRSLQREETDLASTATDEAFTPSPLTSSSSSSMPGPINTTGPAPVHRGCSHANDTIEASHHTPPVVSAASDHVQSSSSPFLPASDTDSAPVPVSRAKSLEGVFPGTPQMSAALPRGFRRSEGTSRLSTGVTPKPFSTKTSRMSTQPRFYSMDDSHSGQRERHQLPASFPHRGIDTTPDYKDDTRSSTHEAVQWRKKKEEERGKQMDSAPSIHSFMSASVLIPDKAVCVSREDEVDHRDMQVSLNQTPNSGTDFGFQARWDSTGARIKSVQPGSPAHLCHLHAGDEIVALGGQRVAEMSYEKWKANMDAALREGKLLMDIRRLSLNGHPDHHAPISNTSSLPMENESNAQVNGHPVNGLPSKAMHRSFHDNPVAIKNKGGSESAISDLQVPSIGASSSCRSWNAEEERRKQEKWQMEQEHLLQEKYRRDQERLEEAWRRDQQEAALEENSNTEKQDVPSFPTGNIMHYTPPPFLHRSNSPTFVALTQQAQEAALVQNKQVQIAAGHPTKDECDSSSKTSQWPSESYGFTKLTASDRKKSKSTPSLDGSHKQDSRVGVKKKGRLSQAEQERQQILEEMRKKTPVLTDSSWIRQRHTCTIHKEPVNVAPLRRHESLDNIRSSSSSGSSSKQFSSSSQPLSGLSGIIPYRGYSGRCSLGPGAAIFSNALKQSSWSRPTSISPVSDEEACNRPQQCDSVSAAGLSSGETQSLELRCESDTDSSSATPVTTDSESVPAFPSDHDASQQITEETSPEDDSDTATTSSA